MAGLIAAIPVDPAVFGLVDSAAALGAGLAAFRDGHAELSRQVQAAHVKLASRAAGAAQLGEQMVRDTSASAGSVSTAGSVP